MDGTCEDLSWSSISDSSTYVECAMKILYAGVGRRSQVILFLAPTHHAVNFLFDGWNGSEVHATGSGPPFTDVNGGNSPDMSEDDHRIEWRISMVPMSSI